MQILQDSTLKNLYNLGSGVKEIDQPEDLQADMEDHREQ